MRFCDVWIFDLVCIINTGSFIYNDSHICQSSWVVVVGGAVWMEEVGGVVVGWDR